MPLRLPVGMLAEIQSKFRPVQWTVGFYLLEKGTEVISNIKSTILSLFN